MPGDSIPHLPYMLDFLVKKNLIEFKIKSYTTDKPPKARIINIDFKFNVSLQKAFLKTFNAITFVMNNSEQDANSLGLIANFDYRRFKDEIKENINRKKLTKKIQETHISNMLHDYAQLTISEMTELYKGLNEIVQAYDSNFNFVKYRDEINRTPTYESVTEHRTKLIRTLESANLVHTEKKAKAHEAKAQEAKTQEAKTQEAKITSSTIISPQQEPVMQPVTFTQPVPIVNSTSPSSIALLRLPSSAAGSIKVEVEQILPSTDQITTPSPEAIENSNDPPPYTPSYYIAESVMGPKLPEEPSISSSHSSPIPITQPSAVNLLEEKAKQSGFSYHVNLANVTLKHISPSENGKFSQPSSAGGSTSFIGQSLQLSQSNSLARGATFPISEILKSDARSVSDAMLLSESPSPVTSSSATSSPEDKKVVLAPPPSPALIPQTDNSHHSEASVTQSNLLLPLPIVIPRYPSLPTNPNAPLEYSPSNKPKRISAFSLDNPKIPDTSSSLIFPENFNTRTKSRSQKKSKKNNLSPRVTEIKESTDSTHSDSPNSGDSPSLVTLVNSVTPNKTPLPATGIIKRAKSLPLVGEANKKESEAPTPGHSNYTPQVTKYMADCAATPLPKNANLNFNPELQCVISKKICEIPVRINNLIYDLDYLIKREGCDQGDHFVLTDANNPDTTERVFKIQIQAAADVRNQSIDIINKQFFYEAVRNQHKLIYDMEHFKQTGFGNNPEIDNFEKLKIYVLQNPKSRTAKIFASTNMKLDPFSQFIQKFLHGYNQYLLPSLFISSKMLAMLKAKQVTTLAEVEAHAEKNKGSLTAKVLKK